MENENKSGIGIAIILGAMILFAFDAKADVKNEMLVWADECPTEYKLDIKCKKKIYVDKESVDVRNFEFQEFQKIADEIWKKKETWKQKFRQNFIKKYSEL